MIEGLHLPYRLYEYDVSLMSGIKSMIFNDVDVELPCSPDGLGHVRQTQIARYGCCWPLKCPHLRLQRCSRSITVARPVALAQSSNVVTLMFSVEARSAKSLNVGVVVWQRKDVAITGARHLRMCRRLMDRSTSRAPTKVASYPV
jgi:hypothetical protein